MLTRRLPEDLAVRVLTHHPVPIADAVAALVAAEGPFEQRDRVVEVFRAALRTLGALALSARVQFGPGPSGEAAQVPELLRALRNRGLTDGQWQGLVRELLRPWSGAPASHPLPELVTLFHARKSELPKLVDELLLMRKAETVAHGASGTKEALGEILERRVPQLARLLELTDPLWEKARLVVPLALPDDDAEPQRAWLLMGSTPPRGRWRWIELAPAARMTPGEALLVGPDGAPLVALHPLVLVRRPSPEAVEEFFTLDGGSRKGAVYVALPSMAEHREAEAWTALERALADDEPPPSDAEAGAPERPYRGLASFGPEHAALFFGREELAEALANRIRRHPVVTVTGPSGSGKTSLLDAGTLPQLRDFTVAKLRPGSEPIENLASALAVALAGWMSEEELCERTRADPVGLGPLLTRWGRETGRRVILVIDQTEEVFTLCLEDERRVAFAQALASAESDPDGPARVVLSVREDFFGRLATLAPLRGLYSRQVEVVTTPDREALARTLIAPARHFGFTFEDEALVAAMVDAVAHEPAALALLQFCADRLWEVRDRAWKRLTWDAYRALGGVEGALATHADRTLDELTPPQRLTCRSLMLRLVTGERTRAVARPAELLEAAARPAPPPAGRARRGAARLVTVGESDTPGEARVEIVHEALLRHWDALRRWLDEDVEGQRLAHALRTAAREWDGRDRPRGLLWRGDVLQELRLWRRRSTEKLTGVEEAFAEASEADARRGARIRRGLVAAALAATTLFGLFMFTQWRAAVEAQEQTAHARARAEVRGLVSEARQQEPAGRATKALALFRAASALEDAEHEIAATPVSLDLERLERSGAAARVLAGHTAGVWRMALAPDGRWLATASMDETARIWDLATGATRATLGGHGNVVLAIAVSPDGRIVATGTGDPKETEGVARLWDAATGKVVKTLAGHQKPIRALAFSPDGALLATAANDGTARLWDVASGAARHVLGGHEGSLTDVAFSPDGKLLATASDVAKLWDVATGAPRPANLAASAPDPTAPDAPRRPKPVLRVAFSPDGKLLATASADGAVALVDTATGAEARALTRAGPKPNAHDGALRGLAFSLDGKFLATAGSDKVARIWEIATGALSKTLGGHGGEINDVVWSRDGARLATACDDRVARVWDARTGGLVAALRGHEAEIVGARFSPDGKLLVTGAADKTARIWPLEPALVAAVGVGHEGPILDLAVSPGGARVASASQDKTARLWDAASGAEIAVLRGHEGPLRAIAFSPDGARIATAANDATARLWDGKTGKPLASLTGHGKPVGALAFSPDGARLATASADGTVRLWSTSDGAPVATLEGHAQNVAAVAFSPDGTRLVSGSWDRTAKIWDVAKGALVRTLEGQEGWVVAVAISQSGKRLATAAGSEARLWDLETGAELHKLTGHEDGLTALAFSPDDRVLATASADGTLRTWNAETGASIHALRGHGAAVLDLAWSSDGERIASASGDDTARLWHAGTGALLATFLGHGKNVGAVAFLPGGDRVASGGADGVIALWRAPRSDRLKSLAATGAATNLRVCRQSFEVVAVLPFPPGDSVWAPPGLCGE